MREGWKAVQIEDVAKVANGGTPKTKVPEYWGGEHVWITPAEMGRLESPYLASSRRKLSDSGLQHSSATLVPSHSVILSTRAPIGHLIINSVPMAFNQGCRGIVPGENVHHKYLYYFLRFSEDLLNDLGSGTTFKELSAGKLKKVEIPLPPLPEQKRIVAILDGAFAGIDAAIANTEKNLANARELFESYMNVVFGQRGDGWSHAKFSDAVSTVRPPRKVQRKEFLESGQFPIVSQEQGTINGRWSRQEDVIRVDKPVIIFGDHTRVFKYIDFDFVAGADGTKILKSAPFLHPKYLYYFAQSVPLEGLGYARHYRILKDTDVWYPEDVSDQEAISIRLDELVEDLNKLDAVYNRRLSALAELKQSLLQKAFSGELTADAVDAEDRVEAALA
jgi:type I restriction enzyme S subunit